MVKSHNKDIVQEFYANLKGNIDDLNVPIFHKVFVRRHMFDFSLALIKNYLSCPMVENTRAKELDMHLDIDKVVAELTGFVVTVWPKANSL